MIIQQIVSKLIIILLLLTVHRTDNEIEKTIWLDEFDLDKMETGWLKPAKNKLVRGNKPIVVSGRRFERGVAAYAESKLLIHLDRKGKMFNAEVGACDLNIPHMPLFENKYVLKEEISDYMYTTIEFFIIGDGRILWRSGIMRSKDPAKSINLDVSGIDKLGLLVGNCGDKTTKWGDIAAWANARITYTGTNPPETLNNQIIVGDTAKNILTPKPSNTPRINGARTVGASVNKPFLYKIPVSGTRPMNISVRNLPDGLSIDNKTGIISGSCTSEGSHSIQVVAENKFGSTTCEIDLSFNGKLALTPPMGWNSWNAFGLNINAERVKSAINSMNKYLSNHGWRYIIIDDGWMADKRDTNEVLLPDKKFKDIKNIVHYAHLNGLKMGIYSSPGPSTCGKFSGSYDHELQDARVWTNWGFDYLKYDWCSYFSVTRGSNSFDSLMMYPYRKMKLILNELDRDIVFSICQYGMGNVYTWGGEVGGNLWRISEDIEDKWQSILRNGFESAPLADFAEPGHWNDPDMLVVGDVGWGDNLHPSRLTPNEQYSHVSLWALLSAPMIIGCDMEKMDEFTLNLLTNDDVISINQDVLGKQAKRIKKGKNFEIWKKDLACGSIAVGLFYTGPNSLHDPVNLFNWGKNDIDPSINIDLRWEDIGIIGEHAVYDLWRQESKGTFTDGIKELVDFHGVKLLKISPVN